MPSDSDPVRAGVFIGVARSGGLPELRDACNGARAVHGWAIEQGLIDAKQARLIVDDDGTVGADQIFHAIDAVLSSSGVDQFVVYFAGHGVNINRNEHWLLSDAPRQSNAAVNVSGSAELARRCGARHVVFISDACRSAPQGLQAQNVRGQDIFPNEVVSDRAQPVDQFFACALGRTAAELADPRAAAESYQAVYTAALVEALSGRRPEVLRDSTDVSDTAQYILPVPLEEFLEREVPARIRDLGLHYRYSQQPEALIMAHSHWMSRVVTALPRERLDELPPPPPRQSAGDLLHEILFEPGAPNIRRNLWRAEQVLGPAGDNLIGQIRDTQEPFGPRHLDSGCGVKVRGAAIADCFAVRVSFDLIDGQVIRIEPNGQRAASVAVRFTNGSGTVIPAFAGFLTELTVRDGELVDVGFTSADGSTTPEIRTTRTAVAATVRNGGAAWPRWVASPPYGLDDDQPIDAALAVYAAYARHARFRSPERVRDLASSVRETYGSPLFDLALLGGGQLYDAVPFTPLLARGWALLGALGHTLPPSLADLETTMRDSVWSLYNRDGYDLLRASLASGAFT